MPNGLDTRLIQNISAPSTRIVLKEEDYIFILETILGRDYYPDTAMLRQQLQQLDDRFECTRQTPRADSDLSVACNLSLEEFQAKYVAEDSAFFEEITQSLVCSNICDSALPQAEQSQDGGNSPGFKSLTDYKRSDKDTKSTSLRSKRRNILKSPAVRRLLKTRRVNRSL